MLLMPFSSVVVWSEIAARAHAASAHADSEVESHIASKILSQLLLSKPMKWRYCKERKSQWGRKKKKIEQRRGGAPLLRGLEAESQSSKMSGRLGYG